MPFLGSLVLTMLLAGAPLEDDVLAKQIDADGAETAGAARALNDMLATEPEIMMQVRIEQRIVIRVPVRSSGRTSLSSSVAPAPKARRYKATKIGKCVTMNDVAGVQLWNDDSLILHMRDSSMVRAELEKTCRAKDFYQGFYMLKSGDGMLCSERDVLQARSGTKCEVEEIRQIEAIDDE